MKKTSLLQEVPASFSPFSIREGGLGRGKDMKALNYPTEYQNRTQHR